MGTPKGIGGSENNCQALKNTVALSLAATDCFAVGIVTLFAYLVLYCLEDLVHYISNGLCGPDRVVLDKKW